MAENVFEAVKLSVSTREAAEFYGIKVSRTGMACCPFHDDKNPSMKVDQRFHCFGCGEDGDVIDFTAKLFDLSSKEAAEKLAQDFGLIYDSQAPPRRRYVRQKTEAQKFREDRQSCYRVLSDYYYLLKKWEADRSPRTPEEEPHPRFVEAIQKKSYVEYLLDLFLYESEEGQKAWIAEHTAEITHLERRLKIMAENKPTNRERLREITDGIEQGIKELFESEKYMRYLSVMSRFHRYSVNNTMLIYMQKPDATLVAGYNKWKDQFERHVKKGEHGITIIAPTPYKKKIEEQKLDPDTKAPILDKDGKIVTEEKEIEIPMFRPVKVFDVSQTDGKPLPELASSLSGNVPNYEAFMEALRRSAPVPITFEAMAADTDGYFSADHQKIAIRQGMSEVQTVSATVHEIAHSKLHDPKKYEMLPSWKVVLESEGGTKHDFKLDFATEKEAEQFASDMDWRYVDENQFEWRLAVEEDATAEKQAIKNRHTEEVEAESISYAVCKYFGIETGENSFGYIASWSQGKELKELRASLETINKTSGTLISDIERHYKEICKERGIDPHAKAEPETASIEQATAMPDMEVLETDSSQQEALFLIDDATYLHIQPCDSGWDYTMYDKETMKELDGGQLDAPEFPRMKAVLQICDDNNLGSDSVKYAPLSMIETLQEAAYQQMQAEASQMAASSQLPEAQEQALDEYPMPDEQVSTPDMQEYGYSYDGMFPVTRERALELDAAGLTVYVLHEDNTESMVFDPQEIMDHGGLFGVDREEWEKSPQFHEKVMERQEHQQEREQAFLAQNRDCFAIYQVSRDDPQNVRFMNLDWLKSHAISIDRSNYDLIYTAPLSESGTVPEQLEKLYEQFNLQKPTDFHSPSMSVSDIVAIKQDSKVSCHYCDSVGFTQIPGFLPENPLKNAEMAVEDDYGMIDGIINNGVKEPTVAELEQQARSGQSISLMDLAAAAHREEREKKKSVMEQLKSQPKAEHKKTAPKKSAEREI
ncbi:DNA primase (bacterial type) [[Ruminococcus] torques L2-14]|uniref:DNA primase (Bacterial type) n=1 Tax=[Ruminococcus] torques L2-14 TaxID=657313 RepID=D4M0W7_9FIRM|nr:YodL domain-containing protein [[Ruminococcus] torques]CBL24879.1 DNA primase (bacterial type) [[Ruminococcus] torques L2-14]